MVSKHTDCIRMSNFNKFAGSIRNETDYCKVKEFLIHIVSREAVIFDDVIEVADANGYLKCFSLIEYYNDFWQILNKEKK